MPFLHRRGPDGTQQDPAAAEAGLQASLAALARGGIQPGAEQRLAELREKDRTLFPSDLSVNEFALMARAGLQPVSQVMGSSVYHVGWQGMPGSFFGLGRGAFELGVLSEAWNSARSLALSPLQQEARFAGADAVVGVHIQWGAHGIVGVSIDQRIGRREVETGNDTKRIDLIVTLHVLGTAIVEGPGRDLDVHTTLDLRGAI